MDKWNKYFKLGGGVLVVIRRQNHWRGDATKASWTAVFPGNDAAFIRYVNRKTLPGCLMAVAWRLFTKPSSLTPTTGED